MLETKLKAIQPYIQKLDPQAKLHPLMKTLEQDFRKSLLYTDPRLKRITGEDLMIFEKYGRLELCEYITHPVFEFRKQKGVFGYSRFPFYFEGITFIKDKKSSHNIPGFKKLDPVQLESPLFSKYFNVYSNTPTGSRLALRTDIMDLLTSFKETGRLINISFIEDTVYFNLPHRWNSSPFIHVEMSKHILESLQFDVLDQDLQLITNIIDSFKLNQNH